MIRSVKSQAFNRRTQNTGRQSCLVKYNHKFHPFQSPSQNTNQPAQATDRHHLAAAFGLVVILRALSSRALPPGTTGELLFWIVLRFMHISNIYSPLYDNGPSESESNPTDFSSPWPWRPPQSASPSRSLNLCKNTHQIVRYGVGLTILYSDTTTTRIYDKVITWLALCLSVCLSVVRVLRLRLGWLTGWQSERQRQSFYF